MVFDKDIVLISDEYIPRGGMVGHKGRIHLGVTGSIRVFRKHYANWRSHQQYINGSKSSTHLMFSICVVLAILVNTEQ